MTIQFIMIIVLKIYYALHQVLMMLTMIIRIISIVVNLMTFLTEKERVAEVVKEGECLVDKLLDEIRRGTNLRQRASR